LGVVFYQESLVSGLDTLAREAMYQFFFKSLGVFTLVTAVGAWWVVLEKESRRVAQEESDKQTQLLTREIDAHRATDARLRDAKEAAESANQAKTRYVTGMTHELRTPLNSILGYARILAKDSDMSPKRRESLAVIQRSGEHLIGLIDGLLDLARIEAGRLRLEPVELALPVFVDQIVQMVAPEAEAKGIEMRLEVVGKLPAVVNADVKRLRQILINLLANAVKFTDRGHVTLRVSFAREIARFEIEDSGCGIAKPDLERIFLPFERAASGRSRIGAGLGLTITHLLTELMGGELTVVSEMGRGSTFAVRLYLREVVNPHAVVTSSQEVVGYLGRRRRLLVVDDQPVQRQLLAGILAPLGFEVEEAASGDECFLVLESGNFDAVLMDVEMPGMNGWEVCRKLRESGHESVPVIMVSANVFAKVDALIEWSGCQGFIDKPVMEVELLAILGRTLEVTWTYRTPVVPAARPDVGPEPMLRPPLHDLNTLADLAAIGHVMAIRRKLDEMERVDPRYTLFANTLREPLARFDFASFNGTLKEHHRHVNA